MEDPLLSKTIKKLHEIALDDGKITDDEQNLISTIVNNMSTYRILLDKAVEDGIISEPEKADLFDQRMKIMEDSYMTARVDQVISSDESKLLQEVCKIIMRIKDYE